MKAFALCAKATLLVATLFAVNPRVGVHHSGQFFVASCNLQAGASVGLTDWATPTSTTTTLSLALQCRLLAADQ